jgi:two-component system CheB/CheR fusion protein
VDRLVRAHGGSVEARSEGRGCGSEFIVRLPAFRASAAQIADAHPVASSPQSAARCILVVDDNVDGVATTAMLLEQAGHIVRTARDGPEALTAAREFLPDVVLLDIGLPRMSGYDVAKHLRGQRETASALLIAVTGYGRPDDIQQTQAAGFDHHLVKPVSWDQLAALLGKDHAR